MKKQLKKLFPTFISAKSHHIQLLHVSARHTIVVMCAGYLLLNVVFSQAVSPSYYGLINDQATSIASYLRAIRHTPSFEYELTKWKTIYGNIITAKVFDEEIYRQQTIKNLEIVLEKNMSARDVLYNLYVLHRENKDQTQAAKYFERAKKIDPTIQE